MKNKKLTSIILILIISFFVINHIVYISMNNVYISGDQHQYVGIAVDYIRLITHPDKNLIDNLLYASAHRPPIYPALVAISFSIFGLDNPTFYGALVNSIFIFILGLSIFGIAYHYFKRSLISLVAVVVGLSFPLQVVLSRQVMTELPLTALIALTVYFMLKSNNFNNYKYLLFASIAFMIALLTRFTAGFFLFLPAGYMVYEYIRQNGFKKINRFIIPGLIGIVTPLLFYIHNHKDFLIYVSNNQIYGPSWSPHAKFSLESFLWYPLDLGEVLTIYLFILIIIGFIVSLFNFKKYIILYLWILSAYLFFTFFVSFKSDRFIMPIYPALAIFSVLPIYKIKLNNKLIFPIALISGLALSIFLFTTWGKGPFENIQRISYGFYNKKITYSSLPYSKPPADTALALSDLNKILIEDAKKNDFQNPSIIFTISIEDINKVVYEEIKYKNLSKWTYLDSTEMTLDEFEKAIEDVDYVISKDEGDAFDAHHPYERVKLIPEINKEFFKILNENDNYVLLVRQKFKDGSNILLFRNLKKYENY